MCSTSGLPVGWAGWMLFPLWGGGSKFHLFSSWDVQRGDSSSLEFSGVGRGRNHFWGRWNFPRWSMIPHLRFCLENSPATCVALTCLGAEPGTNAWCWQLSKGLSWNNYLHSLGKISFAEANIVLSSRMVQPIIIPMKSLVEVPPTTLVAPCAVGPASLKHSLHWSSFPLPNQERFSSCQGNISCKNSKVSELFTPEQFKVIYTCLWHMNEDTWHLAPKTLGAIQWYD